MTKELTPQAAASVATLEQSLALAHQGEILIHLDMSKYETPTLESVVGKPFETAVSSKETASALVEVIANAVALAKESYSNPLDVSAALNSQRPRDSGGLDDDDIKPNARIMAEVAPFIALRENMMRIIGRSTDEKTEEVPYEAADQHDRLNDAIEIWRDAVASRRSILETLKKGADGVYSEAEQALARRTSIHGAVAVARQQKDFTQRHARTQATIHSTAEEFVRHGVDMKQKGATLDRVKELRNQLASDYFGISKYLLDQAAREEELLTQRAKEEAGIGEIEARRRDAAQEIMMLTRVEPRIIEGSTSHFEDGAEGGLVDIFSSDADDTTDQAILSDKEFARKAQLLGEAEERLAGCNAELSKRQGILLNIDAELNHMRTHAPEFIDREATLRQTILEDLVVPTILCITPEVRETIEKFQAMRDHDTAKYNALPKLVKDYADAELWFNYEFAPKVIAQLKKVDPDLYASFDGQDTDSGPVSIPQVRRFVSCVGVIVLNRTDTFGTRVFQTSGDFSTKVAQLSYANASHTAQNNMNMMRASAVIANTNAVMRHQIVEQNGKLSSDIATTIGALDTYVRDTEMAITMAGVKLQALGYSLRDEYKYAAEIESVWKDYVAAQEATRVELAAADQAEAEQRRLEAARKASLRKLAGLEASPDEEGVVVEDADYHIALQSSAAALSSETTAKSHATLANMLYRRALDKYGDLNQQSETTTDYMQEFYNARTTLFTAMEAGSTIGEGLIESTYERMEKFIALHEDLPVPHGITEGQVHQQFLATTAEVRSSQGSNQLTLRNRVVRIGQGVITWAKEITK